MQVIPGAAEKPQTFHASKCALCVNRRARPLRTGFNYIFDLIAGFPEPSKSAKANGRAPMDSRGGRQDECTGLLSSFHIISNL